jgi:hypothetical protein
VSKRLGAIETVAYALDRASGVDRPGHVIVKSLRRLDVDLARLEDTFGRLIKNAAIVASHADLQDLDFASSGHTGFASSAQLTAHTGASNHPYTDSAKTWSAEQTFNAGIDLGTSGRIDSNVADAASAISYLIKPTVALTSGTDRHIIQIQDGAGNTLFHIQADGGVGIGTATVSSGTMVNIGGTSADFSRGVNFSPAMTGAGISLYGTTYLGAAYFSVRRTNASTARALVGGTFDTQYNNPGAVTETDNWGGWFRAFAAASSANSSYVCTAAGGWKVFGISQLKNFGTITNWYGGYVSNSCSAALAAGQAITTAIGLYFEEQTRGGTNHEAFFVGAGEIAFRDAALLIRSDADGHLDLHADTSVDINGDLEMAAGKYIRLDSDGASYGGSNPSAGFGHIFSQDGGAGRAELAWRDSNGGTVQITNNSALNVDTSVDYTWSGTHTFGSVKTDTFGDNTAGFVTITDSLTLNDAKNIAVSTTTGTKIGTATTQKLGFWNAAPIVQPATGGAASTFVANTSGIADDTATWDGYTIGNVVKALRNMGLLA